MIDHSDIDDLLPSAQDAILAAQGRLHRAVEADDVEDIVGKSKDLVETVSKIVIDTLGGSYGSDIPLTKLAKEALDCLEPHPIALQGRGPLRQLSGSMISVIQAIAELRNRDGTGHGRSAPSNLDQTHALLIRDAADLWCRWVLATARRAQRAPLDDFIGDISGPLTLHRGTLPALLQDIGITHLGDDDQRRVGLAVARRWSVNSTVMPVWDVIDPVANGELEYPAAFNEGLMEGLLLDHNGYLRMGVSDRNGVSDIDRAVSIGLRLPAYRRRQAFQRLADRVEDARTSYRFTGEQQDHAAEQWRGLARQQNDASIRESIDRIATRIETLAKGR